MSKASWAQRGALRVLAEGGTPKVNARVISNLKRIGFVDAQGQITDAGRSWLAAFEAREAAALARYEAPAAPARPRARFVEVNGFVQKVWEIQTISFGVARRGRIFDASSTLQTIGQTSERPLRDWGAILAVL